MLSGVLTSFDLLGPAPFPLFFRLLNRARDELGTHERLTSLPGTSSRAALCTVLSIAIGRIVAAACGLPRWFVSVTAFNNTESLPLLLLQSLSTTGGSRDPHQLQPCSAAVKAFWWIVGSPGSGYREDGGGDSGVDPEGQRGLAAGQENPRVEPGGRGDDGDDDNESEDDNSNEPDEQTSLLPKKRPRDIREPAIRRGTGAPAILRRYGRRRYLDAWLAKALRNVGELFIALQVVAVGAKLSLSLRLWKISIPLIWALASRTGLLTDDPMLWWAMMTMPVGAPAMKNLALAGVSGTDQRTRMSIAKFLTDATPTSHLKPGDRVVGLAVGTTKEFNKSANSAFQQYTVLRTAGYEVFTTTSPKNFEYVKALGTSHVFDYQDPRTVGRLIEALKNKTYAGALAIEKGSLEACITIVASVPGRRFVSHATIPFDPPKARLKGVTTKFIWGSDLMLNEVDPMILNEFLPEALASGSFIVMPDPQVVGKDLESVQSGLDAYKQGASAKKIVVNLQETDDA
ncbi:hypothetical protein F5B21DRAFT_509641 [Xylaria acuta]|nr:hypothetical protein F5B21DRAFT_509641 [Xylaria acuta]